MSKEGRLERLGLAHLADDEAALQRALDDESAARKKLEDDWEKERAKIKAARKKGKATRRP